MSTNTKLDKIKYSILITNYNSVDTICESLESILNQIDDSFEVIVVDNMSRDGSAEILKCYEKQGKLKLISQRCTRGKGRQLAYENSNGCVLIINMDMDTIFKQGLKEVLELYHHLEKGHERFVLRFKGGGVIHRKLIEDVNGWRDLQRDEDIEVAHRLERIGVELINSEIDLEKEHFLSWEKGGIKYLIWDKYIYLRDKLRVGYSMRELYGGSMRKGRWRTTVYGALLYLLLLIIAKVRVVRNRDYRMV